MDIHTNLDKTIKHDKATQNIQQMEVNQEILQWNFEPRIFCRDKMKVFIMIFHEIFMGSWFATIRRRELLGCGHQEMLDFTG